MASPKKQDAKLDVANYLGPKDLKEIIKVFVSDVMQMPPMIWGQPGVGKSEICAQAAAELERSIIDIRLLLMDPTDLRGLPFKQTNKVTGTDEVVWATPAMFPKDFNDTSIIFLDEINAAPPSVQCAALQLVLNRKIGEYTLPKGVAIVAAGNRVSDRTSVSRMPKALANRFVHFNMGFNFEDWREHAFKVGYHPDVIGYLSGFEHHANTFDPTSNDNAYATPRTWSFVSRILNTDMSKHLMRHAIAGAVGEGVAGEFTRHREFALHLPKPEDVLKGVVTKMPEKGGGKINMQHAMSVSLAYKLKQLYDLRNYTKNGTVEESKGLSDKEWKKIAGHFALFIADGDNFDAEIAAMTMTTTTKILGVNLSPKEIPEVLVFFTKYKQFLIYT